VIAVVTLLLGFPLGYLVRSRLAAHVVYGFAYLWAFTFQTLYLLLDALGPRPEAPAFDTASFPVSYGLVALGIFLVGFALVEGGHRVARRRTAVLPVAA
jgi:hypothetical protein